MPDSYHSISKWFDGLIQVQATRDGVFKRRDLMKRGDPGKHGSSGVCLRACIDIHRRCHARILCFQLCLISPRCLQAERYSLDRLNLENPQYKHIAQVDLFLSQPLLSFYVHVRLVSLIFLYCRFVYFFPTYLSVYIWAFLHDCLRHSRSFSSLMSAHHRMTCVAEHHRLYSRTSVLSRGSRRACASISRPLVQPSPARPRAFST